MVIPFLCAIWQQGNRLTGVLSGRGLNSICNHAGVSLVILSVFIIVFATKYTFSYEALAVYKQLNHG